MKSKTIYDRSGKKIAEYVDGVLVNGFPPKAESSIHDGKIQIFKSGIYEHITEEPQHIKTKADLRAITRSHGCSSDYAE